MIKCEFVRRHPLYGTWCGIKNRCYNKLTINYHLYGGRGITMQFSWRNDFCNFLKWALVNGWDIGLEIDRIDTNGNYEEGNCRWVTKYLNSLNKRNTTHITFNGVTKCLLHWANELGIPENTLRRRIFRYKIPLEKAMQASRINPNYNQGTLLINLNTGVYYDSIKDAAHSAGFNYGTFKKYLSMGHESVYMFKRA